MVRRSSEGLPQATADWRDMSRTAEKLCSLKASHSPTSARPLLHTWALCELAQCQVSALSANSRLVLGPRQSTAINGALFT